MFVKSILEFMKDNSSRFNDEKLDIMCNMNDYVNNNLSDEESVVIYNQIQAIKNTMELETSKKGFDDNFSTMFNKRDLMSLGTMYLMAINVDKKIYEVEDGLIYFVINSLRGEKYEDYTHLLKGLLNDKLLEGVKIVKENEPTNTDRVRSIFCNLVDNKIISRSMDEKEFANAMQSYLETKEIPYTKIKG